MLDTLGERAEKEIVSGGSAGKNLIGHCAPFLSKLCRNFSLMQKVISSIIFSFLFNSLETKNAICSVPPSIPGRCTHQASTMLKKIYFENTYILLNHLTGFRQIIICST